MIEENNNEKELEVKLDENISEKEIEAASKAFPAVGDSVFNPQQQFPMAWPATFLE